MCHKVSKKSDNQGEGTEEGVKNHRSFNINGAFLSFLGERKSARKPSVFRGLH